MPGQVAGDSHSHQVIVSHRSLPWRSQSSPLHRSDFVVRTVPRFPNRGPCWATVGGSDADKDPDGGCRAGIGLDYGCQ